MTLEELRKMIGSKYKSAWSIIAKPQDKANTKTQLENLNKEHKANVERGYDYNSDKHEAARKFKEANSWAFQPLENPNETIGIYGNPRSSSRADAIRREYNNMIMAAGKEQENLVGQKESLNDLTEAINNPVTPDPEPTVESPNPTETAGMRRRRLLALRRGILSTVKTGGEGLGSAPNLITQSATQTPTGASFLQGVKQKLGL